MHTPLYIIVFGSHEQVQVFLFQNHSYIYILFIPKRLNETTVAVGFDFVM